MAFYSTDLIKSDASGSNARIKGYNLGTWTYARVTRKAANLPAGFGLANFLFTFPAYRFIDDRGRRPLLLVSFVGMLFSLAAVTGFFKLADPETRLILVSITSIALFVFFYSIGAGPIPFTLSAEVFPLCVRGKVKRSRPSMLSYAEQHLMCVRRGDELQRHDQLSVSWAVGIRCALFDKEIWTWKHLWG